MKKALILFTAVLLTISSSAALTASIDQNPPEDIVLSPENDYSSIQDYSSSTSNGEIKSREWNLLSTAQTDSGVDAEFEFDRSSSASNTVRLTVSDGNTTDVAEITQTITDIPNASISVNATSIDKGDRVKFTSNVTNEFGEIQSRKWKEDISAEGASTVQKFSSSGQKTVKLQVNDSQGNSYTTNPIVIDVSSPENTDDSQSQSSEEDKGLGGAAPESSEDNGTANNQTSEAPDQTKMKKTKNAKANFNNGVAQVTLQKDRNIKNISIRVNPASERTSVKNIRISSNTSGEVKVSVKNIGSQKPEQVSENPESEVYSYQEINTSINDTEIDAAEISFRVNQSWLSERNRSTEEIVMKRYKNNSWESLETRYINSTQTHHNYEASSEGFSFYAVSLQEDKNSSQPESTEKDQSNTKVYLMIAFALIAIAIIVLLRTKDRNKHTMDFDNFDFS